jgi:hypothetical protein
VDTFETYPVRRERLSTVYKPSAGIVPVTTKPSEPEFKVAIKFMLRTVDIEEINSGKTKLLCIGIIEYSDALGEWETGWCWEYMAESDSPGFRVSDNDELNYHT